MKSSNYRQKYTGRGKRRNLRNLMVALTRNPRASVRELARSCGIGSTSTVSRLLAILRDYGYVDFEAGTERARTVLIPWGEVQA